MSDVAAILETMDYKNVLKYFTEISKVPRGSGFNQKISDYLVEFAKEQGLEYVQDELLNVVIYKPATPGYEKHTPVIVQGHMDMVCVTAEGVSHDFENEALELFTEGDWLGAKGTTLGGDDGIAVAFGMALLADKTISHPALEIVITTDEETGMYGAKALNPELLKGRQMINVDSEDEGMVLVSCAGGLRTTGTLPLRRINEEGVELTLHLHGLLGGHSGAEIHKYRISAVYQLARLLFDVKRKLEAENSGYLLTSFTGGEKDNAIPTAAVAKILVAPEEKETLRNVIGECMELYQKELSSREPGMKLTISEEEGNFAAIHPMDFEKLLFLLMQAPNGVQMMSKEIEGLVESSLNLGIFEMSEEAATIHFSVRSSVSSYKYFVRDRLTYLFEFLGGECESGSEYPAWEYKKDSALREKFIEVFKEFYGKEPKVEAIHAGLECGLICEKIPEMDIVSIGPDMRDIHTPQERLSISSSVRVYRFVEALLAAMSDE
ncbi:MAG: aminoacyl-histidine dipeptidase [Lachnospiraceae bacterium]|nr:aminoacyl-histidine dipeptidase [Lachnospiraceae bacterium]